MVENNNNMERLKNIATQVRRDSLRMVHAVQSGHPGGSLGCADFMVGLFFEVMNCQPENFTISGKNEDMFFMSNGHITPVLYSTMARRGYFNVSELATFRKLHTRLQGHPSVVHGLPGIRAASGSLGQGISIALGACQSKKMDGDKNWVYVLTGDGELQEGQNWEALMYAGAKRVDNIILTVDYNRLQIDGAVEQVMDLGNLADKFRSFMWDVIEGEGNDMEQVIANLSHAKQLTGKEKPVAFLMHTKMGCGVDFMENKNKFHGTPLDDEQLKLALSQLEETIGDY